MKTFTIAVVLLVGCGEMTMAQTPQNTSSVYPCTVLGHACDDSQCCRSNETCGGDDPTCPNDRCCSIGGPDPDQTNVLGEKRRPSRPKAPPETFVP